MDFGWCIVRMCLMAGARENDGLSPRVIMIRVKVVLKLIAFVRVSWGS